MDDYSVGVPPVVGYTFRGQSDSNWRLRPSIHRVLPARAPVKLAHFIEAAVFSEFSRSAVLHLPPNLLPRDDTYLGWWPILQHWGAPTRLLDWTRSPFVASYFALRENPDRDGAVWLFHGRTLEQGMKILHPSYSVRQRDIPSYFKQRAPRDLMVHHSRFSAERMSIQQALFTVSRNPVTRPDQVIEDAMRAAGCYGNPKYFLKMVIPKRLKIEFLRRLRVMNITAASLFPDLDGLGRASHDLSKMLVWHHKNLEDLTKLTIFNET